MAASLAVALALARCEALRAPEDRRQAATDATKRRGADCAPAIASASASGTAGWLAGLHCWPGAVHYKKSAGKLVAAKLVSRWPARADELALAGWLAGWLAG